MTRSGERCRREVRRPREVQLQWVVQRVWGVSSSKGRRPVGFVGTASQKGGIMGHPNSGGGGAGLGAGVLVELYAVVDVLVGDIFHGVVGVGLGGALAVDS